MNQAIEKIYGNAFAVTSIGVAMNAGEGVFKAYDPETKQIKVSRTILPLEGSFVKMQVVDVLEGDFIEVGGTYMQVVLAGEAGLGLVNPLTGEQKNVVKEVSPDGLAFVTVVRSTLPDVIIKKLTAGKLSATQLGLISGDISLDKALAMALVAEKDELSTADLMGYVQATK